MTCRSPSEPPWLSVAMPIHHGGRWLRRTLESIAAQDCRGIELIVHDSSENEECGEIVFAFADRLSLHYRHMPETTSWQIKTNLAVERASAAHVAMLHQDDLWLPNRVAELRHSIAAFPDAVLMLNPSHIVDEHGARLGVWRCPLPSNRRLGAAEVAEPLLVQNFVSIPAPVIRRSAWLDCRGLDPELWYTADWDLYLKLVRCGPVVYRDTPSTAFRVHGSSLTISGSRDLPGFERQMRTVLDRHGDLVPAFKRSRTTRRAKVSITVNCALAQASAGSIGQLGRAALAVLTLGPVQAAAYIRESRILERAWPRLRARLAGSL